MAFRKMESMKGKDLTMRRVTSSPGKKSHSLKHLIQKLIDMLDQVYDVERKEEVYNEISKLYNETDHSDPMEVKTSYTKIKAMVKQCLRDFYINHDI